MSVEGMLGKHVLNGERAATDDHPAVLHHLPLSETAREKEIPIGTVMKRVAGAEGKVAYEPYLSTDEEASSPWPWLTMPAMPETQAPFALCMAACNCGCSRQATARN